MGSIMKNGIAYGGGGTDVVANPSGTATDTLEKLKVGSTVYDIAGGGSHIVQPPVVDQSVTYTYNRTEQTLQFTTLDTNNTVVTNNKKTDAGTYTCTVSLKGRDDVWADTLAPGDRTFSWTINPKTVTIPTVTSTSKTYNGSEQSPTISQFDSNEVALSGTYEATNAGNYTLTMGLTSVTNYVWSDTTVSPIDVAWSIAKAASSITIDDNDVTLDADHLTATINVTATVGDGTLSASSSDTNVATVSQSGTAFTISSVDSTGGTVTITFALSETSNYAAGSTTATVHCDFGPEIVSFSTGTDEQIKAMLDAYYADQITWAEMGWNIGDTRTISLASMTPPTGSTASTWAAQNIVVVIVDHDHTDLATPINGHSKACITVQTRECMNNLTTGSTNRAQYGIYVNGDSSYDMSFTKWSNLYMRTYLNSTVWGAFPSTFKAGIKPSSHYRHTTYNGTESEQVTDNLFLPSYPEIYGTASYSNYVVTSPVEGTQFSYYATSSNRIKYGNNNGASNGTAVYWWEGSASSYYYSSGGYYWCSVAADGSASRNNGTNAGGLAPAFAM